jgi:5S rRNA maturation endonuclease (ribonuclease M5)
MTIQTEDLKRRAAGRWVQMLQSVGGLSAMQLNPKIHGPCPRCGGTDRFRAMDDVTESGGLYCNQCFSKNNGDGLAAVQWLLGCTFNEAKRLVADAIGPASNGHKQRNQPAKSKKVHATAEEAADALAWGMVQSETIPEQRKPDVVWHYHNADGSDAGAVFRWNLTDDQKEIRQVSAAPGGWITSAMREPRPLYRLPEILDATEVWICEGEKSADSAVSLGLQATTSAGGSKAAEKSDWQPLDGKRVYILPDNDEPGEKFARDVVELIRRQAPNATIEVKRLKEDWPIIPDGGDVFDWSEQFDSADARTLRARLIQISDCGIEFVGDSSLKHRAHRAIADKTDEFIPFPIDELPPVLATFCREVGAAVGCDESFPAMVCLSVCAAAIGTSRQLCIKHGWFVPPIIWAILVGESGTQKSPPFRMATAPLKDRQQRDADFFMSANVQYQADLKAYKCEHRAWERKGEGDEPEEPRKPIRRRCLVQDATIEALAPILNENPRGVLLARDELSGWLAGFDKYSSKSSASSEVPKWLEIYNTEPITIDRKTGDEKFLFVRRPSVSICGGIQPGILSRCLTAEHKDSGLQSRLLMTYPPRHPKQWRDDEVSPATQTTYGDCVRGLFELKGDDSSGDSIPATLKLSPEARALYKDYVNQTGREQAAMHGHLASHWSKLEEIPARLVIILHCVRQVTTGVADHWEVDDTTMQSAINLGEWFKNETLRIGRMLVEPESLREARHLAEWIQSQGRRITARDLSKRRRDIANSDVAESKLIELVELGFGAWNSIHKSREFVLNVPNVSAVNE